MSRKVVKLDSIAEQRLQEIENLMKKYNIQIHVNILGGLSVSFNNKQTFRIRDVYLENESKSFPRFFEEERLVEDV